MPFELERPRALTPEVQKQIIEALALGSYLRVACEAAGITYGTFYHWQRRWRDGDPAAQVYDDFFNAVKRAGSCAEVGALADVRSGRPGWQGSAWFLERRFPRRWGKRDRAPVPLPPRDLSKLTDEELERYRREVEGKGAD